MHFRPQIAQDSLLDDLVVREFYIKRMNSVSRTLLSGHSLVVVVLTKLLSLGGRFTRSAQLMKLRGQGSSFLLSKKAPKLS